MCLTYVFLFQCTNESLKKISDVMSLSYFETKYCRLPLNGVQYIENNMPHCELKLN
jgi:hypothetical protein